MKYRIAAAAVFTASLVSAQEAITIAQLPKGAAFERRGLSGAAGEESVFKMIGAEFGFGQKVVKGAPFQADVASTVTQVLPDGNRINRVMQGVLARDGEGRTHREMTLSNIGALSTAGVPDQLTFINDAVANSNYVLNSSDHSAHKIVMNSNVQFKVLNGNAASASEKAAVEKKLAELTQGKVESIGTQMIEGVSADGTRTTTTIVAGQIGNDKPIDTVVEQWYSPELQTVVLRKRTDPRSGEETYKLTNIRKGEPPAALFTVPSDYTLKDAGGSSEQRTIRIERKLDQ